MKNDTIPSTEKKQTKKKLENLDESRWIAYHGEVEIIDIKL